MKLIKYLSLVFLLLLSAYTNASSEQTDINEFNALYAKLKSAMNERDPIRINEILAPKFQSEDISGNIQSSEQMLASLESLPNDPNKKSQTTLSAIEISGNIAKVVQTYHMTTTKAVANNQTQSVELTTVSDDTWSKIGGTWRLLRTVTQKMDFSKGGKLLIHKIHE